MDQYILVQVAGGILRIRGRVQSADKWLMAGGHPEGWRLAARHGPWAVDCSAERARSASTLVSTWQFATAGGIFTW